MVLVALIHVGIAIVVIRAFTPNLPAAIIDKLVEAYDVVVFTPPPPQVSEKDKPAAPEGRKATPRAVSAPKAVLPINPVPAPTVSGTGADNSAGAARQGDGSGAGGVGTGKGGGGARKLEKLAGDISSARDYRKKTRDLRIGQSVTILLIVGTDGRVSDCRITQASPDAEADATTCRLAAERFRFRPASDRNGNPVAGQYAWRQRWYYDPAKE